MTTTPLPISPIVCGWISPEGIRCSLKVCAADRDGVPGVIAAVVARHAVGLGGEQVHHAAFAFVTPLGADDDIQRACAAPYLEVKSDIPLVTIKSLTSF